MNTTANISSTHKIILIVIAKKNPSNKISNITRIVPVKSFTAKLNIVNINAPAKDIAENFEISARTVYRYIEELSMAGIPIICESGKNGGISISPNFLLESFLLNDEEKSTIKNAFLCNSIPQNVKCILNKFCV